MPNHGLIPVTPKASSCRLVFPTKQTAPDASAARSPRRQLASRAATGAVVATALLPAVVGSPTMSMTSFTATRTPGPDWSDRVMNVATPRVCQSEPVAAYGRGGDPNGPGRVGGHVGEEPRSGAA